MSLWQPAQIRDNMYKGEIYYLCQDNVLQEEMLSLLLKQGRLFQTLCFQKVISMTRVITNSIILLLVMKVQYMTVVVSRQFSLLRFGEKTELSLIIFFLLSIYGRLKKSIHNATTCADIIPYYLKSGSQSFRKETYEIKYSQ